MKINAITDILMYVSVLSLTMGVYGVFIRVPPPLINKASDKIEPPK